ncbi:MAG: carbon-nitrogen hydrolase family protein [Verrucomicrobiae bacterium]|nr:carbon-nitrogen hydrolase family protein [Verrucomicrobiae bacterium]
MSCIRSLLVICLLGLFTGLLRAETVLFESGFDNDSDGWEIWSPRPEIEPAANFDATVGRTRPGSLFMGGAGNEANYGSWRILVTRAFKESSEVKFSAWFKTEDVENEMRSIIPRLNWKDENGKQVRPPDYAAGLEKVKGWTKVEYVTDVPAGARQLDIQLGFGFAPEGKVWWDDVSLTQVPGKPVRPVRVATIHHKVRGSSSVQQNLDEYIALIDQAGKDKPDIICLPEGITTVGNPFSYVEVAESIPGGPSTLRLGEAARRNHCYIVAGIYESVGDIVYNTSILLDRQGQLAGTYRKTHLPREEWEKGITPGDDYPVFKTDFGTIGMMICWDVQFPEPATALARQGAELILLPIWGGNETLTKARAIENHVYLVSSTYDMRSFVLNPLGEVLAEATDDCGYAVAEIDLDQQYFQNWIGNMKHRTWKERRPDISLQ